MRKIFVSLFTVAFVIGFSATISFAQMGTKGENVERKIKFAKGKSTATVKSFIESRMTTHTWTVTAKANQTMTVVFTSKRKDVDFCVDFPNGGMEEDTCSKRKWTLKLPDDGDYTFTVDSKRENTPYTITVTIN